MYQRILDKTVDNHKVFGVSAAVTRLNADGTVTESWQGASGNLSTGSQFFIASTTKLMITAVLRQLRHERKLAYDDMLMNFLDESLLNDVLVIDGKQVAPLLTIRQLMGHTSGLPDYFQRNVQGRSLQDACLQGIDTSWELEEVLERVRGMRPAFRPDQPGKAEYSDTNYQLLGRIVEVIEGASIAEVLRKRIVDPLGLTSTYMYADTTDMRPAVMYHKQRPVHIPHAMASFKADGGVVSTAAELMLFLQAFFNDTLAPSSDISELTSTWNRIWFPFTYATGIMRFTLPWIFSPFRSQPELIGHSGLSGAFAFYAPARNTMLTGTVNQLAYPDTSFRLMLKLAAV